MLRDSDEFDEQRGEIMARFVRLDVMAQSTTRWSLLRSTVQDRDVLEVSPGGQFCVLTGNKDLSPLLFWDLRNNRVIVPKPEVGGANVFSRDGRFLAAESLQEPGKICVFDLETLSLRKTLLAPEFPIIMFQLRLSADGSRVAAQCSSSSAGHQTYCWNVASGAIELHASGSLLDFADGGSAIVVQDTVGGTRQIEVFDLPSGQSRRKFLTPLSPTASPATRQCLLSHDGETLLAPSEESNTSIWEGWATKLGLTWPFKTTGDRMRCQLYDLRTGDLRSEFVTGSMSKNGLYSFYQSAFHQIPDGRLVTLEGDRETHWRIWDIPPRKSLSDLAVHAAVLAALIAIVTWRVQRWQRIATG